MKEFPSRLREIIAHYNISASGLADNIGVQRSSISHILSGRNKPSLDFIMKLVDYYPSITLKWLAYGEGNLSEMTQITKQFNKTNIVTNVKETSRDLFTDVTDVNEEKSHTVVTKTVKENTSQEKNKKIQMEGTKTIEKIIVLYSDGTFMHYNPKL